MGRPSRAPLIAVRLHRGRTADRTGSSRHVPSASIRTWDGAGGIGGVFERMFAPRVMRAIYADELERLDAYARERRSA
jgi:hypothetical protein